MPNDLTINIGALEPLYTAWEEPNRHRIRSADDKPEIRQGRRRTRIEIAQNLRAEVKQWRDNYYFGASETTRHLLTHWFGRAHEIGERGGVTTGERRGVTTGERGGVSPTWSDETRRADASTLAGAEFRYYFCQREAIETFVYLKEVARLERLSQVVAEFGGPQKEMQALGIPEEEDAWSRYAFKMATGSGKTKVMSLAMVWSYFHALRESDSPLARNFVVIAPNLTVFERLKEDFKPEGGGPDIFDRDPLIPVEWRGDWNLTTVLQDEAGGAATAGVLYLTNIHRLYDPEKRARAEDEMYDFAGPTVRRAKALDTGALLRERITGHQRILVLNDEAHHLWDQDSSWNEAIAWLNENSLKRGGEGIAAQLDFSATPKDNKANYFKHIVCDTPLGEAVDAGIVKTPIIASAGELKPHASDDAGIKYDTHLQIGYQRWLKSKAEWEGSGKKPLMFVMCDDTAAADQIAARLNGNSGFKELNGRTINLHTNLKGKVKKIGKGAAARQEFVESDSQITDEDLKALRKLSRELDQGTSPYMCIVSVLMLREGWDVRNVTTIVPLRPYSSSAGILAEQTLGRGLRRMTPPGQANEIVAVVDHAAFTRLYKEELSQEGLFVDDFEADKVPITTVSIFPDPAKDRELLDIPIPRLTAANQSVAVLSGLTEADVRAAFKYEPLSMGTPAKESLDYEGRQLITGELVEQMTVRLHLLENGVGALSYYVQELEYICKVKGTHAVLAPLLQTFFEQILFGPNQSIFEPALVARLSGDDVRQHVRAVFVPLIRARTVKQVVRKPELQPVMVSSWRPFQVTASERRPVSPSDKTIFNLVPCNRNLEQAMKEFLGSAEDVRSFAKNAGPQALRIDYLASGGRLAFYIPDFFVRSTDGAYYLLETKGQEDREVPAKVRTAVEWCKSASEGKEKWQYVYVPEETYLGFRGSKLADLLKACEPRLRDIVDQKSAAEAMPLFAAAGLVQTEEKITPQLTAAVLPPKLLEDLPERFRKAAEDAAALFMFLEQREGVNLAPAISALFGVTDEAAKQLVSRRLTPEMPTVRQAQDRWFEPLLEKVDHRQHRHYKEMAHNLKKTLVFQSGVSPLGLLRNCLDFALNDKSKLSGVFDAVHAAFRFTGSRKILEDVQAINDIRNTRVAHQEKPLTDRAEAKKALVRWVEALSRMWQAVRSAGESEQQE